MAARLTSVVFILFFLLLFTGLSSSLVTSSPPVASSSPPSIYSKKAGKRELIYTFAPNADSSDTGTKSDVEISVAAVAKVSRCSSFTSKLSRDKRYVLGKIRHGLVSTFMPVGWPARTPPGYFRYCVWSWTQHLSTELRSLLATQRVLEGVGVGRAGASALSAALNFIVRDGAGMAGSLIFTAVASSKFRPDVKRWRLFADVVNDVGITLTVAATLVPTSLFLPMICVGSICQAMCGVAAGACGGAINLYWSKGSDISDINAKFGAQNTVAGSLGLVFAAFFAKSVSSASSSLLWTLYSILTLLHIYANSECMKLVAFDSFNNSRMNMVVTQFLAEWESNPMVNAAAMESNSLHRETIHTDGSVEFIEAVSANPAIALPIQTPAEISIKEPLFFFAPFRRTSLLAIPVRLGLSFDELARLSGKSSEELQRLANGIQTDSHIATIGYRRRSKMPIVLVAILSTATSEQVARAYFHALLLERVLWRKQVTSSAENHTDGLKDLFLVVEKEAYDCLNACWADFQESAKEAGWDLSRTDIRTEGYGISVLP